MAWIELAVAIAVMALVVWLGYKWFFKQDSGGKGKGKGLGK